MAMDNTWWPELCGNANNYDAFWSPNITTETSNPDFTRCLQDTVLVWIPIGLFLLCQPFYFFYLRRRTTLRRCGDKGALQWTKLALSVCLLCLTLVNAVIAIATHEQKSSALAGVLRCVAMLAVAILTHYEFSKAMHTSGVLNIFLFVETVISIIRARSGYLQYQIIQSLPSNDVQFVLLSIYAGLLTILFLLNIPADMRALTRDYDVITEHTPLLQVDSVKKNQTNIEPRAQPSPEISASFLNKITFLWYTSFVVKGWKKYLHFEDLYDILSRDKCDSLVPSFLHIWQKKCDRYNKTLLEYESKEEIFNGSGFQSNNLYKESNPELIRKVGKAPKPPSLLGAIFWSTGRSYWISTVFRLVATGLIFLNPFILTNLLDYLSSDDPYIWKGICMCFALGLCDLLHITFITQSLHFAFTFGIQARAVVTAAIYRKVLKLSSASKKGTTTGQILNLMSVDAQRIQDCPVFWNNVWVLPPIIILATYFMWNVIGVASLVGVGFLILLIIPINGVYVSNRIKELQVTQMAYKDSRLKLIGEILNGIKVLKLYAWEKSFLKKVIGIREDELNYMKKSNIYSAVSSMTWNCTTYVVTFVIFGVHVAIEKDAVLTAQKVFVTNSLVGILNIILSLLPMGVSYIGQTWVALDRITKFLLLEEIEPGTVVVDDEATAAISIDSGSFAWNQESGPMLKDIQIRIPQGKLVAVVGKVGSGKSSLISAILGDMWKIDGNVTVKGNIAYVSQLAWIQNKTVRDNITFSRLYESSWYNRVVKACALEQDFKVLMDGDQTEIGEKGINLSGGQKQRISVSRAVYQDADIYLLDDPLSAVDAHVGKHLFDQVIGPNGVLKKKTRLLITHSLTHLPSVDYVIVMDNGDIVDVGTYQELLGRDGAFAEFLNSINNSSSTSGNETENKDEQPIASKSSMRSQSYVSKRRASRMSSRKSMHSIHSEDKPEKVTTKLIEDEVSREGNLSFSVIKAYVVAGGTGIMLLTVFFHLLFGVSLIMGNIWLSLWTDDAEVFSQGNMTSQSHSEQNIFRLSVYGGIICSQVIVNLIGSLAIAIGSVLASRILHHDMLDRILHAPMMFFDTTPMGRVINRLARDMDTVDFNVPMYLRQWFWTVVPLIATIVIISYATPMFLAAVVPLMIFYWCVQKAFVKIMRQLRRIDSVKRSPLFAHFDESLSGASSIRAYKEEDRFIRRCDDLIDDSQRAWYLFLVGQRWLSMFLELIGMCVIVLASVLTVIQKDIVSAGEAGMSISFSLLIYVYLTFYVRASAELETYMVAVERIKEYSEIQSEAAWDIDETRPVIGWPREGHVKYEGYSTRYRPGLDLVLKEVNCDITQGQKVGVVGRTGAGKSSVALSLFRIIEAAEGKIRIDGVDISTLGLYALRSRLTIIPQDPVIFSGSIRMNLDPLLEHTDEEIWSSLALSHLKEFVNSVPERLEYECGENGEALCIGQRQLLCLARALLRRSRVLVLDEATAAIDLETDELIQNTIRTAFQECTILTIAHRINTILDYDRVIVMDAGRIVEFESPVKLLQNKQSIFYGMAKSAGVV